MNQTPAHKDAQDPSGAKVSAAGWRMLALIGCTQLLSLLDRNILAILNPRIKHDLAIGDAEMGLLYGTVFAFFYALFSLPIGRLADGWIRTRLLAISILVWSASTGLAAFAGGFALLAISRLGVGIGEAAAQPAGTSLVYDHFPKARRGLAMAVMAAALATGLGLSSVLGGVAAGWWDNHYQGSSAPFGFFRLAIRLSGRRRSGAFAGLCHVAREGTDPRLERRDQHSEGSCSLPCGRCGVRGDHAGWKLVHPVASKGRCPAMGNEFVGLTVHRLIDVSGDRHLCSLFTAPACRARRYVD